MNAQTGVFDITTWVKDLIARMDGLSTSKFKCIEDIPYPSQKIADNPSARLRGEQERLFTNLSHNHENHMRKNESTAKKTAAKLKEGREDKGCDESGGE